MNKLRTLFFIDADLRRRAAMAHSFANHALHVEPFETVAEFTSSGARDGLVLVHDHGDAIERLITGMTDQGDWCPIVAFRPAPDASRVVAAVLEGALEYLSWPIEPEPLERAIERVERRLDVVGRNRMREAIARGKIGRLTDRERQVLGCVADGLSNRKIGEKLSISPRTVEIHRANMLNKLGAGHSSQAIRIAIEAELGR